MKLCKRCGVARDEYHHMLSQDGKIVEILDIEKRKPWYGHYCYSCVLIRKKERERLSYGKRPLQELECFHCGVLFKQKCIQQKFCYRSCKEEWRKKIKSTEL